MNTEKELKSIKETASSQHGAILPSQLPKVSVDVRSLLAYAQEKKIAAYDLSDDEKSKFVSFVIQE